MTVSLVQLFILLYWQVVQQKQLFLLLALLEVLLKSQITEILITIKITEILRTITTTDYRLGIDQDSWCQEGQKILAMILLMLILRNCFLKNVWYMRTVR